MILQEFFPSMSVQFCSSGRRQKQDRHEETKVQTRTVRCVISRTALAGFRFFVSSSLFRPCFIRSVKSFVAFFYKRENEAWRLAWRSYEPSEQVKVFQSSLFYVPFYDHSFVSSMRKLQTNSQKLYPT